MNRAVPCFVGLILSSTVFAVMLTRAAQSEPAAESAKLRHVVLFKFKEDATDDQIQKVIDAFAELPKKIDEIQDFEWGREDTVEDLTKGFTHCFLVTFKNQEDLKAYLPHPAHQEFVTLLRPVLEDVLVVDYLARQ